MADVPSNLKDWSTTASSNTPNDSTTIGGGLADNFQQLQATVRQDLASKGADIASAGTTDLGAVPGKQHDITGTTTITSFGTVAAGIEKIIKFEGVLTLTHNATSLILPFAKDILTGIGDVAIMVSEGSGNWRCASYQRANAAKTIANDAAVLLGSYVGGTLTVGHSGGSWAQFMMRGSANDTTELSDASNAYTKTKDNATTTNVYYDTDGYYLQNKTGGSLDYYITLPGA